MFRSRRDAVRPSRSRRIFCNRTLNLRSIEAIGYDMDYTLVHYNVEAFERHAYEHIKKRLLQYGWPIAHLKYDPRAMIRGLFIDARLGNIVKANRFGFVKTADHGTRRMDYEEQRRVYQRTIIDLADKRFALLNTFFTLSEGCLYAQLVDLFDRGKLRGAISYADIHERVRSHTDAAYLEGELKPAILADPDDFIVRDPGAPLALQDQLRSGKKLMLITNSDWNYTDFILTYAFDPHLPRGMTWRDLFSLIIVSSDKPSFFSGSNRLFEVVDERESLLKPAIRGLRPGGIFLGGNSKHVERYLGLSGDQILYVGDHIVGDVQITKDILRWRTALIVRELEDELVALERFAPRRRKLSELIAAKEEAEREYCGLKLALQRREAGYGPREGAVRDAGPRIGRLRARMDSLDARIEPLTEEMNSLHNRRWGLLLRAGNDKSYLARMVEQYADIYMSRVSNMAIQTPFAYMRSTYVTMPHDE